MPATPEGLFGQLLVDRPDAPLVTWYDETPGAPARVELSARSVATWAAKTAGLLGDELGLGPGDIVVVDLPSHWLTVGVLAGCWAAGVEVVTGPRPGAAVAIVSVTGAGRGAGPVRAPDAGEVFTVDPRSALQLAGPDDVVAGARDLPTALRPHADRLPGVLAGGPDDPALNGVARVALVAAATARAGTLGLTSGARLLWTAELAGAGAVVAAVLAPWTVSGSLVLVTGPADSARLDAVAAAEGTTHRGT